MAVKLLNIRKLKAWQWTLLIILNLIVCGIVYFPGYSKLKELRNENKRLTSENKQLEKDIIDFKVKIEQLDTDSYLYEKIARDSLGVAKENEIVIDIGE